MAQLNWTETQWDRVNSAITEEFTKASVAGAFLPCYGPLEGGSETVQKELLSYDADGASIKIRTDENYTLWNLRVHVALSQQQVLEESLSSAMLAFRRAATRLAKAEDYIVFCGHSRLEPATPPALAVRPILTGVAPDGLIAMVASGGPEAIGLTEEGTNYGGTRVP
ncbi:MAG: encapsulin, partial [Burkholderiales bacterium]|nr:encapsulin [Burkholderiales bacterium]